ncbi:MAG: hypothetical protein M3Q59_08960 [Actinomycetota bacterium]|nr:hypothetical protein [Actinomycetota bacterium]
MREESHLDDMRAAIRGDFERLEERRGERVLLRPREQPELEPGLSDPITEPEDATVETALSDGPELASKRSWIDRLLGV